MLFLGLTDPPTAARLSELTIAGAYFATASAGAGVVVVCAEVPGGSVFARAFGGRLRGLSHFLSRQRLLEAIAAEGAIVAAADDAEIGSPEDVVEALGPDLTRFVDALTRYGLKREYQILVAWDAKATQHELSQRPDDELVRAHATGRRQFAQTLAERLHEERAAARAAALAELAEAAEDIIALPNPDVAIVVDAIALIAAEGTAGLDCALACIEANLIGEPRVRAIGPLPAASFAAVELRPPDAAALAETGRRPELRPGATSADLKAAFGAASAPSRRLAAVLGDRPAAAAIAFLRWGGAQGVAA